MNHVPRDWRGARRAVLALAVASALALLASACGPYPQNIFERKSDFAIKLDDLFTIILVGAAIVFVVVQGALFLAVFRFRRRPGDRLPKQIHGDTRLEVLWTVLPSIVLAVILVPSTRTIFETQAAAPADSLTINVYGHRFWWRFEYPTLGIVTANEVHMPVGRPVNFVENSADVIHSFWIPALGGKRDVVPGHTNYLWWTANSTGVFPGQCAELCGDSHANMRIRAFVQTQEEFDAWVRRQQEPAAAPAAGSLEATGAQLFQSRGCAGCHVIRTTRDAPADPKVGPDLTHVGSRTTLASAMLPNTPEALRRWLKDPPGVKPQSAMPNLGLQDQELDALVAYLRSLR